MSVFKVPQILVECADCGCEVDETKMCPVDHCEWCLRCCPFGGPPCSSCGGHLEGEGDADVMEVEGQTLCVDCSSLVVEREEEEEEEGEEVLPEPTLHQPEVEDDEAVERTSHQSIAEVPEPLTKRTKVY
jgi:hypothetical protein